MAEQEATEWPIDRLRADGIRLRAQRDTLLEALKAALPILSALCTQKGLDPGLLGYESGGWTAKEAVRAAIAEAEAQP